MATTLEAVYENVKALEVQVERLDDRFEKVEAILADTRGELREISSNLRTRAEFENAERERLRTIPERLTSVETTMKSNAETLRAVLEGTERASVNAYKVSQETRDAWIGEKGFLRSKSFVVLLVVVMVAILVLLRAVDPATVTAWLSSWEIAQRPQVLGPAQIEGLSESK